MTFLSRRIIVHEPFPVAYVSWGEWRALRQEALPAVGALLDEPLLRTCPFCQGQRRVWYRTPEGYVPRACKHCIGTGLWAPRAGR